MIGDPYGTASAAEGAGTTTTGDVHRLVPTAPDAAVPRPQQSARSEPARTGDVELDAAMVELARAQSRSFAERIDSGERVHRLLQGRLGDLGRA